jgi:hypothetical protein
MLNLLKCTYLYFLMTQSLLFANIFENFRLKLTAKYQTKLSVRYLEEIVIFQLNDIRCQLIFFIILIFNSYIRTYT